MVTLTNEGFDTEHNYACEVQQGVKEGGCRAVQRITIQFKNHKFVTASFNARNPYTLEDWDMLGLINDEIKRLKKCHDEKALVNPSTEEKLT